jgi:hypothetical protein
MLTYEVGSTLASYIISLKNKHYLYILVDASLDWCATHCTPLGRAEFLQYTLSLLAIISIADNANRSEIDMFSIEQEIRPRIR